MKYSIWKGVNKGLVGFGTAALTVLIYSGMADVTLWSLLEQYLKPILGVLTIQGALVMLFNFFKIKAQEIEAQ